MYFRALNGFWLSFVLGVGLPSFANAAKSRGNSNQICVQALLRQATLKEVRALNPQIFLKDLARNLTSELMTPLLMHPNVLSALIDLELVLRMEASRAETMRAFTWTMARVAAEMEDGGLQFDVNDRQLLEMVQDQLERQLTRIAASGRNPGFKVGAGPALLPWRAGELERERRMLLRKILAGVLPGVVVDDRWAVGQGPHLAFENGKSWLMILDGLSADVVRREISRLKDMREERHAFGGGKIQILPVFTTSLPKDIEETLRRQGLRAVSLLGRE